MFRRFITASFLKLVTKISLAKLTIMKIPLRGLGVVLLAMGLPVSTASAGGQVTLSVTGIVGENIPGPIDIFDFEAQVIYNTQDRVEGVPSGATGRAILYPDTTIILSIDGQPTVTNTTSRIIIEEGCCPGPGDSLQIGDEGNGINPSGWVGGKLFGREITALSWNFGNADGTAFDSLNPDLPFVPDPGKFEQNNGSLNLEGGNPVEATYFFNITNVILLGFLPDVLAVDIDIKPGSFPNSINQGSGGVIPVAILGSETFDATLVDGGTCTLGDAMVKIVGRSDKLLCSVEDVNDDGFLDQVCKFVTIDLGAAVGDTEASIHCSAPEEIEGTDSIRLVPPE